MDLVVSVAIGVLSVVFVGSLLALCILCIQRHCLKPKDKEAKPILRFNKNDSEAEQGEANVDILEAYDLRDVFYLGQNIEKTISEQTWSIESEGPLSDCLAILKTCHLVAERFSNLSFKTLRVELHRQDLVEEVLPATRQVVVRVDDLAAAMHPPCDLCLLESRAAALVFATRSLVLLFRALDSAATVSSNSEWLAESLSELDFHLRVLRETMLLSLKARSQSVPATSAAADSTVLVHDEHNKPGTSPRQAESSSIEMALLAGETTTGEPTVAIVS